MCEQSEETAHRAVQAEAAELAAAFRAGAPAAFDRVVALYKDRLYNVLYRILGNHEDALDVAQEAFIRAWRKREQFAGRAQVYTWLYQIAANLARNRLRDGTRKGRNKGASFDVLAGGAPSVAQQALATSENPRDHAAREELGAVLEECLAALADHYRMAFVLRIFDGLDYAGIAATLDCREGTVKSRLNKARGLLRTCLQQHGHID
ncbi:MAG: RNA polymerase sigma factor [Candidatus Hydrogenedentota bacterium]